MCIALHDRWKWNVVDSPNITSSNPLYELFSSFRILSYLYSIFTATLGTNTFSCAHIHSHEKAYNITMGGRRFSIKSVDTKIAEPSGMYVIGFFFLFLSFMKISNNWLHLFHSLRSRESQTHSHKHKIMVQSNNEKLIKWKYIWQFQSALHTKWIQVFRANRILYRYLVKWNALSFMLTLKLCVWCVFHLIWYILFHIISPIFHTYVVSICFSQFNISND